VSGGFLYVAATMGDKFPQDIDTGSLTKEKAVSGRADGFTWKHKRIGRL